jgi:hypothetical protein
MRAGGQQERERDPPVRRMRLPRRPATRERPWPSAGGSAGPAVASDREELPGVFEPGGGTRVATQHA